MSSRANQLARAEKEEIARAVRALLARPLVARRSDPAAFDLVRKRRGPLVQWFDYFCGWRLVVEPRQGYARLVKVAARADATRPARRPRGAPFDRRRYTLLCLCAAELLAVPVTTIGDLMRRVTQAAAVEPGVPAFDPARGDERAAFADALKLLEHYGALTPATDSPPGGEDAPVLYHVDTTLLIRLLATPTPPSRSLTPSCPAPSWPAASCPVPTWPDLAALLTEPRHGGDDPTPTQATLRARHTLLRRLLDEPVVYRDELTPEQSAYAASSAGRRTIRRAAEEAGLVLEERAEGFLLVDPDGTATDTRFPDDGSPAKVAALLLLDPLLTAGPLTTARLEEEAAGLLGRFPRWARSYRSDDGAARLAADALEVLALFGLARRTGDRVAALPAAARYRVADLVEDA
ncbi:TIGR02678 family protein [Actinomadura sp. ATCC 31491]|uniref:TIGR02678 family protein n=1 Tax=Actinomadura luzonensis TaxID=2805427 RepID=A0ABT0G4I2_9ACTN|nr:TIGR02678 family protein [Actinomadura luzonensis]MCK2219043.1 TIGR02678 family protein [Actinomadura luzonensis]